MVHWTRLLSVEVLRIVIQNVCRAAILYELHSTQMGMCDMKSLARSYLWWLLFDVEIKNIIRDRSNCVNIRLFSPISNINPTEMAGSTSEWVHVDFSVPSECPLVVLHTISKWLEVFEVSSSTTKIVILKLQKLSVCFRIKKKNTSVFLSVL